MRSAPALRPFLLAASIGIAALGAPDPASAQTAPGMAEQLVDGLEGVFGRHAGARRSGARGICATGELTATEGGRRFTTAATWQPGARSTVQMLEHLRLGEAQFGAQPVRVSMASRPGALTIGVTRGLHGIYRLTRMLRDRFAGTRPVPPAEES